MANPYQAGKLKSMTLQELVVRLDRLRRRSQLLGLDIDAMEDEIECRQSGIKVHDHVSRRVMAARQYDC